MNFGERVAKLEQCLDALIIEVGRGADLIGRIQNQIQGTEIRRHKQIREDIGVVRRMAYKMPESPEAWSLINIAQELERILSK